MKKIKEYYTLAHLNALESLTVNTPREGNSFFSSNNYSILNSLHFINKLHNKTKKVSRSETNQKYACMTLVLPI